MEQLLQEILNELKTLNTSVNEMNSDIKSIKEDLHDSMMELVSINTHTGHISEDTTNIRVDVDSIYKLKESE